MRLLLGAVLVAAVLWSGYWVAGSRLIAGAARDIAAQTPGLTQAGIGVAGFPNRFDLTVTAPRLADPVSGTEWTAPFVQVLTLGYRPWHMILALPPEQRLAWPGGGLTLTAGDLRASLVLRPVSALPLDRLTVVGSGLMLVPDLGPRTGIDTLRLATRPDPSRANAHEIALEVAGIAPDPAALATLPAAIPLPARTEALRIVAFAGFTAPLDRFAGDTRPALTGIDLRELSFAWGPIRLSGSGMVGPDAGGLAEGRIDLGLDGWRPAIDAAVALGLLRPEIAPTWAEFARRLAEQAGTPDRIELPLTFAGGRMRLGPIPLGPAPLIGAGIGG